MDGGGDPIERAHSSGPIGRTGWRDWDRDRGDIIGIPNSSVVYTHCVCDTGTSTTTTTKLLLLLLLHLSFTPTPTARSGKVLDVLVRVYGEDCGSDRLVLGSESRRTRRPCHVRAPQQTSQLFPSGTERPVDMLDARLG